MKKQILFIVSFIFSLFTQSLFCQPEPTKSANKSSANKSSANKIIYINNKTLETLKIPGSINLNKVIVEEETNITGELYSQDSDFGRDLGINGQAITANGQVNLVDSRIHGKSKINGKLESTRTTFFKNLLVNGKSDLISTIIKLNSQFAGNTKITDSKFNEDIEISNTDQIRIENSTFEKSLNFDSNSKQPIINLINSKVLGDITFKGRTGAVVLSKKSKVYGQVTNGRIIKK